MPHDHAHEHRPSADLGPAFRWAVGLNTAYVIVEATAGFLTGSLYAVLRPVEPAVRCMCKILRLVNSHSLVVAIPPLLRLIMLGQQ